MENMRDRKQPGRHPAGWREIYEHDKTAKADLGFRLSNDALRSARQVAQWPEAEREAYWRQRQLKAEMANARKRKTPITLPTLACLKEP